jgi:hypothetical protein
MAYEAILVVKGGPNDGEMVPLGHTIKMGRLSDNDVVVREKGVSRNHAEIVESDTEYRLRDLSSTNGTFVNGEKIVGDCTLKDGDDVRLGTNKVFFTFHLPGPDTEEVTLKGATDAVPPTEPVETAPPEVNYEGTVRLRVNAGGKMGLVVEFARRLHDQPDFRLLRMVMSRRGDTEIWLALRRPVSLRKVLGAVEGVLHVSPTRGRDLRLGAIGPPLTVQLGAEEPSGEPDWTPCGHCKELLEPGITVCPRCRWSQA